MGEKRVGEKDLRFIPVASSGGVNIFASAGGLVSFANSPYYAHEHGQAVDIYPLNPEAVAFSPIRGDLLEVFTVKSPRPRYFQAAQEERLLIVRPSENPNLVARILHTESLLEKGARLSVGTPLGRIARSGFYNFWTEYHVHVEARNPSHLLRAKGSLQMEPLTSHSGISGKVPERPPSFRVAESNENYTLVEPEEGAVVLVPLR